MNELKLKAIKGTQLGGIFYTAMMKISDLVNSDICEAKKLNPQDFSDANAQRPEDPAGMNRIARDIKKVKEQGTAPRGGFATPTGILLASRTQMPFDECSQELVINTPLSIMDGQHRIGGWRVALEKNPELGDNEIPVVIIPNMSEENEIVQFGICNYLAKKPSADHFQQLVAHLQNRNTADTLIPSAWERKLDGDSTLKALQFVLDLNSRQDSVWRNRIILDGLKSNKTDNKTKQRAVADVLHRHVLISTNPVSDKPAVFLSYWKILKQKLQGQYPDTALFKSTGCEVFNRVFVPFIGAFLLSYGANFSEENMSKLLDNIFELLPENKKFICNPDFWQTGNSNSGAKLSDYSSRQPREELVRAMDTAIAEYKKNLNNDN